MDTCAAQDHRCGPIDGEGVGRFVAPVSSTRMGIASLSGVRRFGAALLMPAAGVLVAACGSSTTQGVSLTLFSYGPSGGANASMVVTSDTVAIRALKNRVIGLEQSDGGLFDGSKPVGPHICGYTVTKDGHDYQVEVFGNAPSNSCDSNDFRAALPRSEGVPADASGATRSVELKR